MTDIAAILSRYGISLPAEKRGNALLFPVTAAVLADIILSLKHQHALTLKTVAATDERREQGGFRIYYVFSVPRESLYLVPVLSLDEGQASFPSLTPLDQEFSLYELEIYSFFGLRPEGHPDPRRVILHAEQYPEDCYPLRKDFAWNMPVPAPNGVPAPSFQETVGEGIYEIPVGPVHAGIIEPGHFRFSVLGEEILRLEPRLGYVHKGAEKLFENLSSEKRVLLSERISGDSSFHHSLAYVQALEALAGIEVPERAKRLRVAYAELERLANHLNDLAFIMLDTGFSFGGSQGTRLRERLMLWNERLTGSRFLRGVAVPGGVRKDLERLSIEALHDDLEAIEQEFSEVIEIAMENPSVQNRLKGTGVLDRQIAEDHGAVGVAARAVGMERDARVDTPYAAYPALSLSVPTETGGDVYARFRIRVREAYQSFRLLNQVLTLLLHTEGEIAVSFPVELPAGTAGIGITEGFRGDIVYFVLTDSRGLVSRVKVRDASFLNWSLIPYAVTRDVVPDFPLINKSFNLSYSGNDL